MGEQHSVERADAPTMAYDVIYGGETYRVASDWQFGQPLFRGTVNGNPICIQVERRNMNYRLFHWGAAGGRDGADGAGGRIAGLHAGQSSRLRPPKLLLSPMPGLLSQLLVEAGDEVKAGQDLAVVEAMKMENVLRAEHDGVVATILADEGDTLMVDQPILKFE